MSQIIDENGKKKFDLRVTILDPKTGKVQKHQPYQFHCRKGHDPEQWYVRAGVRYAMNGDRLDPLPKAAQVTQSESFANVPAPKAKPVNVEDGLL